MNAEGVSPVHIDSKWWKAPRSSSSRPPSREGVASRISGCHESKAFEMQKHLEGRFERNDHADMPDGHSSLASALVVTTLGVRRAKEVGTAARHAGDIELASAPAP